MTSVIDETELLPALDPLELTRTALVGVETELDLERQFASLEVSPATQRRRWRRVLQVGVLATPVLVLACLVWTHRNMFADGYIYLHVVQNILAGHGPVFNVGQRVEAVTSPAWTAILSVFGFITPFPLTWIAVVLGMLCTIGGITVAIAASAHLIRRQAPGCFLLPIGAVVFVALPPVWSLASTGLETGLVFLWLAGCLAILVRWSGTDHEPMSRIGAVVLGIGILVRPELLIDSAVFMVVVAWLDRSRTTRRSCMATIAWAAAMPVIYELFRMGYYGSLVANTAITKEATLPGPGRGLHYFSDFVGPYWLFLPIAGLLLGAYYPLASSFRRNPERKRSHLALLALPIAGALNAGYIIMIGGDYIHARLFMGAFFALCAPVAVIPLKRSNVVALLVVPWAMVCALTFRTTDDSPWSSPTIIAINGHGSLASPSAASNPSVKQAILTSGPQVYVQFGGPTTVNRLDGVPAEGLGPSTIATSWIGPESYQLGPGVRIVDLLGLADPLTAHLQLAKRGAIAGHEKPLPTSWVAAILTASGSSSAQLGVLQKQRPDYFTPLTKVATGRALGVQTAWARAALQCRAISDLRNSTTAPLTVGTFLSNVYHSVTRTTLRIPPNPETAYHQFCGPGTPPQVRALLGRPR